MSKGRKVGRPRSTGWRRWAGAVALAASLGLACGSSSNHGSPPKVIDSGAADGGFIAAPPDSGAMVDATSDSTTLDTAPVVDSAAPDDATPSVDTAVAADTEVAEDSAVPGYPAVHAIPPEVLSYGGPVMMTSRTWSR